MSVRNLALLCMALLCPAALAGCSSPEPGYFTLAPVNGPAGGAMPLAPRQVELRRVSLPGYLDRDEVVQSDADYHLKIANFQRWGEPLGDMIGRVLAQDLTQRLPGRTVYGEAGAISGLNDATVAVDIQRFDAGPDGRVILIAQVAVTVTPPAPGGPASGTAHPITRTNTISLSAPLAGMGTTGMVATMSTLLGQLADRIAPLLNQPV